MLTGRDSLALFNQRINDARGQIDGAHHQLELISEQLAVVRQKESSQYRELARLRLDNIAAGKLIEGLDGSDRAVLRLLAEKANVLDKLSNDIDTSLARQTKLAEKRKNKEQERDEAFEAVQDKIAETSNQLAEVSAYQEQKKKWQMVVTQAQNAQEKAEQAENDRVEKGKPYEKDPLFMYLWRRRYLTPDYEGGWLTRMLDRWVAKLIDFEEARPNYFMLNELPVRLKEHAGRLNQSIENELSALHAMEAEAARNNGIPPLQASLDTAEKALHQLDDDIAEEEKRHADLLNNRSRFSAGEDEFSQQAIELQVGQLKRKTLADLFRDARATSTPKDDVVVTRIEELANDEKRLTADMETLKNNARQNHDLLEEIERLRRWFRRQNYDSQYSRFPTGFTLGVLLDQLLRGALSSDRIREQIRREQKFRIPRKRRKKGGWIDFDGGFGGGFSGGSGGFGGGFGSGGGFGGGGFRTGGGF